MMIDKNADDANYNPCSDYRSVTTSSATSPYLEYEVQIRVVENGFVCFVGGTELVFEGLESMLSFIRVHLKEL